MTKLQLVTLNAIMFVDAQQCLCRWISDLVSDRNFEASKEVGVQVNAEKTECKLLSRHQNAGQNLDMKAATRSFENRSNKSKFHSEGNWMRLILGDVCYHWAQNFLSSRLLSTNVKIRMYKNKTNKLHGLIPRANYTDRATAACQRSECQLLRIKGATWSAWRIPTAVFSVF
jgi:hypothetical protein